MYKNMYGEVFQYSVYEEEIKGKRLKKTMEKHKKKKKVFKKRKKRKA